MIHCYFCGKRMKDVEEAGYPHHDYYAHIKCEDEYEKYLSQKN